MKKAFAILLAVLMLFGAASQAETVRSSPDPTRIVASTGKKNKKNSKQTTKPNDGKLWGWTIDRLATRKGPGTQYAGGGTYNVKHQYIRVLARAYDKRNGIWWVKCIIPYHGEKRTLWTGYKRFDKKSLPLESIPIENW